LSLGGPDERQLDTFLETEAPFLAIARDGRYLTPVPPWRYWINCSSPCWRGSRRN